MSTSGEVRREYQAALPQQKITCAQGESLVSERTSQAAIVRMEKTKDCIHLGERKSPRADQIEADLSNIQGIVAAIKRQGHWNIVNPLKMVERRSRE